jgi:hypothetical protein
VGSIDGLQIRIRKPHGSGKSYFCRKQFHAINALCIVDVDRRVLFANAQSKGPSHDSTAWLCTGLSRAIDKGRLPKKYFIVGDDAFKAVSEQIVTPWPGKGLHISHPDRDAANFYLSRMRIEVEWCDIILIFSKAPF